MGELTGIAKVVVIIAALIALRWGVQIIMRKPISLKTAGSALSFMLPPLITGGPMFIAIPASLYAIKSPDVPLFIVLMSYVGGLCLSIGLVAILTMLQRQKEAIHRLEALLLKEGA